MEQKKFFLRLYDVSFEVSEEQYVDYYKEKRRAKYLEEIDYANGLIRYQAFDTDNYLGEGLLSDKAEKTEDIVENKLMTVKLKKCLVLLDRQDRELIEEIFFKCKTEREISTETGVPQKTINCRKQRILMKLRKYLENI